MESSYLDPTHARRIIDDLVTKYPVGPQRRLRPTHYTSYGRGARTNAVSHEAMTQLGLSEIQRKCFGYDPLELFKLGVTGEDSARRRLINLYAGITGPKLTRRSRLLWERVSDAWQHIMISGHEGIWSVSSRHAPADSVWRQGLPFWGRTAAEAESQARTIGPMMDLNLTWRLTVDFKSLGTKEGAFNAAVRQVQLKADKLRKEIDSYKTALAHMEKQLQEENEKAVKLLGGVMLLTPDDEQAQEQEAAQ